MIAIDWADWGLRAPDRVLPVSGGLINRSFCAEWSDGDRLFVQQVNTQVFTDLEAIECNLQLVLDHPISAFTVAPILRRDGRVHGLDGWRVFPFVSEADSPVDPGLLGRFWGEFTATLNARPAAWRSVLPHFHSAALRWEQWSAVRDRIPSTYRGLAKALEDAASTFLALERDLPAAVQHHDAKRSNVIASAAGLRAIDLDTLQMGYLGSDFGDLVRSTAALRAEDESEENGCDPEAFEAVWEGYASAYAPARELAARVRQMPAYLTWLQALRFATDAASGNTYYAVTYGEQNWHRAQNQRSLLESLLREFPFKSRST